MNSGTPHFEQAFSPDGGKSWEVNWDRNAVNYPPEFMTTRKPATILACRMAPGRGAMGCLVPATETPRES
jgi:hypothetical protein